MFCASCSCPSSSISIQSNVESSGLEWWCWDDELDQLDVSVARPSSGFLFLHRSASRPLCRFPAAACDNLRIDDAQRTGASLCSGPSPHTVWRLPPLSARLSSHSPSCLSSSLSYHPLPPLLPSFLPYVTVASKYSRLNKRVLNNRLRVNVV